MPPRPTGRLGRPQAQRYESARNVPQVAGRMDGPVPAPSGFACVLRGGVVILLRNGALVDV